MEIKESQDGTLGTCWLNNLGNEQTSSCIVLCIGSLWNSIDVPDHQQTSSIMDVYVKHIFSTDTPFYNNGVSRDPLKCCCPWVLQDLELTISYHFMRC